MTTLDAVTEAEIDQQIREDIMQNLQLLHKENTSSKIFEALDSSTQTKIKEALTKAEIDIKRMLNHPNETILFLLNEVFTAGKLAGIQKTLTHLTQTNPTTEKETSPAQEGIR